MAHNGLAMTCLFPNTAETASHFFLFRSANKSIDPEQQRRKDRLNIINISTH